MSKSKKKKPDQAGKIALLEAENRLLREQLRAVQTAAEATAPAPGQDSLLAKGGGKARKLGSVETLVGGIAHDFNNLLAGIMGNLFLLLRQVEDGPQKERLREVQKMCQNAADITAQLLIYARKSRAGVELLPLHSFMHDFNKMYQALLPQNICFEMGEVPEELAIRTNVSQFQQILLNLLSNAQDAVAEEVNPSIGLSLEPFDADDKFMTKHPGLGQRELVRLSVIDNGCGMSAELQQKVFTPFFSTRDSNESNGLGLALVAAALKQQHGVIELNSIEGQGTIIRIYLPRESLATAEEAVTELEYGRGELLLLADDDSFVRESHKEVLTQLGYRVLAVSDGRQAVEAYQEYPQICMAILDVAMPVLDGISAASELQQLDPQLPILFMTGYADRNMARQALPEEAEVLQKPASMPELSSRVHKLLSELPPQD